MGSKTSAGTETGTGSETSTGTETSTGSAADVSGDAVTDVIEAAGIPSDVEIARALATKPRLMLPTSGLTCYPFCATFPPASG